ncbi:tetratricopeptide repeat protein [Pseudoduganella sp. S-14]|uniref:tetratricopeptide repeat protein n=1 Tax=Pseudoduganella sp. S-14 TaxID=3404065 RepID=UPI003CEAA3E4
MRGSLIAVLIGAATLAGCAADAPLQGADRAGHQTLEKMLADADRAAAAGLHVKSHAALKAAAASYPAEKAPWLQMAQMRFDRGNYSDAIVQAQEALQRDPADKQALSIIAVAGLRLSTRSLAELNQQSSLGGSVRSEAQELARTLRNTLGEDVLVPVAGSSRQPKRTAPPIKLPASRSAPNPSTTADPFGALK